MQAKVKENMFSKATFPVHRMSSCINNRGFTKKQIHKKQPSNSKHQGKLY